MSFDSHLVVSHVVVPVIMSPPDTPSACRTDFRLARIIIESVTTNQLQAAERKFHPPIVPCELPDGIRLVYADDHGREHAVGLEAADLVDFGLARPLRKPPAYRGQRNFPGWWWSATTRSHVVYESWLERHHIIEADRDADPWRRRER